MNGTPDADDALRIEKQTNPQQIREYVKRRAFDPIHIGREHREDLTVWNFSTHKIDTEALSEVAHGLALSEYVVPYQVPGVWGFMQELLPKELAEKELLVYSQADETYKAFENLKRTTD